MKQTTIQTLNQLNKDFYTNQADSFSQTRIHPWPAFVKSWELITNKLPENPQILDIGCGNGRYLTFLNQKLKNFSYTGIDFSRQLLDNAKQIESQASTTWLNLDFINYTLPLKSSSFDLIVCWGVMHHIPSFKKRKEVLENISQFLKPNGYLAVSFWQFLDYERFRKKIIPLNKTNLKIDMQDLEKNDILLTWNDQTKLRYCHHFDSKEITEYSDLPALEKRFSFQSDGQQDLYNHCVIWEKI